MDLHTHVHPASRVTFTVSKGSINIVLKQGIPSSTFYAWVFTLPHFASGFSPPLPSIKFRHSKQLTWFLDVVFLASLMSAGLGSKTGQFLEGSCQHSYMWTARGESQFLAWGWVACSGFGKTWRFGSGEWNSGSRGIGRRHNVRESPSKAAMFPRGTDHVCLEIRYNSGESPDSTWRLATVAES